MFHGNVQTRRKWKRWRKKIQFSISVIHDLTTFANWRYLEGMRMKMTSCIRTLIYTYIPLYTYYTCIFMHISANIKCVYIYIYPQHLVITCHHKYVHRFFQSKQCAAPSLLLVHPEVPSKQFVPSVLYFFFGSVDSWPSKLEIKSSRQFRPVAQPGENDRVHLADSDESENSLTKIQSDTEKYVTKCER